MLVKVEAGEWWGDLPRPAELHTDLCWKAFNGSLDAAKALHDAVLPGFGWGKEALSGKPYVMEIEGQIIEFGEAETTARAWLIAILRALIAQADL